jgi:hypothetical protein
VQPPSPDHHLPGFARLMNRAAAAERSRPFNSNAPHTPPPGTAPAAAARPGSQRPPAAAAGGGSGLARLLQLTQQQLEPDLEQDEYESDSWLTRDEDESGSEGDGASEGGEEEEGQ